MLSQPRLINLYHQVSRECHVGAKHAQAIKSHIKNMVHCSCQMTLLSLTKNGTNEAERTAKAGNKKVEFPADSKACKAVFLPNPGFKDIFFLGVEGRLA